MREANIKNVEIHLFEEARHDLFHEIESGVMQKTAQVLIEWIKKNNK